MSGRLKALNQSGEIQDIVLDENGAIPVSGGAGGGGEVTGEVTVNNTEVNPIPVDVKSGTATITGAVDAIVNGNYKGDTVVAHAAGTTSATSAEISIPNYNAIKVFVHYTGSGTHTIAIQDAADPGGTFVNSYDNLGVQMITPTISASGSYLFVGVADQIKIVATRVSGTSTVEVVVVPMNV